MAATGERTAPGAVFSEAGELVNKVLIDLSQPIEPEMTVFPGDPKPHFRPADGVEEPWWVAEIKIGSATGTHFDCPSHLLPGGKTVDKYPLARFILPGIVLPVPDLKDDHAISEAQISNGLKNLPEGDAVLIQTDWDRYWKTERYLRHPCLSPEAVWKLVGSKASLVGIDALNVDSTVQATDHVHRVLFERDILTLENLTNLNRLQPGKVYQFSFLPLRWVGLDASPIRAVAW